MTAAINVPDTTDVRWPDGSTGKFRQVNLNMGDHDDVVIGIEAKQRGGKPVLVDLRITSESIAEFSFVSPEMRGTSVAGKLVVWIGRHGLHHGDRLRLSVSAGEIMLQTE